MGFAVEPDSSFLLWSPLLTCWELNKSYTVMGLNLALNPVHSQASHSQEQNNPPDPSKT